MTRLRSSFVLIVAALVASVTCAVPASPASAAGGDATMSVTPEVWPNTQDGGAIAVATITVQVHQAGLFEVWIPSKDGFSGWETGEQWLDVGTHVFTWDGLDELDGLPVNRGVYRAHLLVSMGDGAWADEDLASIRVNNSTEVIWEKDKARERGTGLIDMDWFSLSNGPDEVEVLFSFRKTNRRNLVHATAALDVDKDHRGYLLSVQRKRGRLVPSLAQAILASDAPYYKRIRCRRLTHTVTSTELVLTVPRSCLRIGGYKMRANYWIGGRDNRVDYGPESGDYWTDFTKYTDR